MLTTSETFVFRFCSIFNNSPQTESKERPRARKRFNKSTAVRKTILRAKPIQQTEDNGRGGSNLTPTSVSFRLLHKKSI